MMKVVWTTVAAAAVLCFSTPAFAQVTDTASVTVNANLSAKAKLTVGAGPVDFPDQDPDTAAVLDALAGLSVDVKVRTSAGGAVTLTVSAADDLKSGSDTIGIGALTWTASAGFTGGTMTKGATTATLGSWTGSGQHTGTQTYHLANSWTYATGNYSTTINYTLSAP